MTDETKLPDALKDIGPDRFSQYEKLGLDGVLSELNGRPGLLGLSSSGPAVQAKAWEWVRWKKAEAALMPPLSVVPPDALRRIWGDDGYRLFLSHRSDVKKDVAALKATLEVFGARCFVAHEDIRPTQDWRNEILHGLGSMHCFVAIITDGFHESDWTDQEIGYAVARNVPVIALMLGNGEPKGFIDRFQARRCTWDTATAETLKIIIAYPGMFAAYVEQLRRVVNWDTGNVLGTALPWMWGLAPEQLDSLVEVFNHNSELRQCFAFTGTYRARYGAGLLTYLNKSGARKFGVDKNTGLIVEASQQ